ncbi:MAG: CRISPR-associated helicase Cas3', partial [Candidatus Anammoxibacter sp.]
SLHDIGKISPGFQKKINNPKLKGLASGLSSGFETNHSEISESSFNSWIKKDGQLRHNLDKWGVSLGEHHGKRDLPMPDSARVYGGSGWQNERHKLVNKLIERFGGLPASPPVSKEQVSVVSGLVSVADWIASDEEYFPSKGLKPDVNLELHVKKALDGCGWLFPEIVKGLTFKDIFDGMTPRAIQNKFINSIKGPGVYLLEGPMGIGKTEAALYGAYKLMSEGHNSGLYFGLPTRLTSDKIHERTQDYMHKILVNKTECKLIHGQAWLRPAGGEEFDAGQSWFHPSKRAIIAPFGVGTIDQALLSALRVRHSFVRTFGLAGKVVILDEVHSYDVYTGTLLDALIKKLLAINCSVFILSATLTTERKRSFFCKELPDDENYPLITSQINDGKIETTKADAERRDVKVRLSEICIPETALIAVEKARRGMCVIWIANTVYDSQEYYKAVIGEKIDGDAFDVGLLHARFPAYRRNELESEWINALGKDGARPDGCILIATQIAEQSVDIDADFMISDLAPTDMLLQRIGRLWRHTRNNRPCPEAEFLIRCTNLNAAISLKSIEEMLGKSGYVYAPYVLWRSYQVWKTVDSISIPDDIRRLLEETYKSINNEPQFILELNEKLNKEKEKLRLCADGSMASSQPETDDNESVATRHSSQIQIQALLTNNIEISGYAAKITLINGDTVHVDPYKRDISETRKLYQNIVPLNKNSLREFTDFYVPRYLSRHIYGELAILSQREDGKLLVEGKETNLAYDNFKGVYKTEDANCVNTRKEEYDDESDW